MRAVAALAACVLLALLPACAPPKSFSLAVDSAFTPEERTNLLLAADMWRRACGIEIDLRFGDSTEGEDVILRGNVPQGVCNAPVCLGYTWRAERIIALQPGLPAGDMAHEFGHLAGLHHVDGPGIMHTPNADTEVREADLAEGRRVGVCD